MYSGKTSLLLSRQRRYEIGGKKCLIIKYSLDTRYDDKMLVTHNQNKKEALSVNLLSHVDNLINNYNVILIDEIQFYKDASFMCDRWANQGKIVEGYGLNGDYRRKPFEQISELIPLADNITHLTAIDKHTGKDAPFTFRLGKEIEQEVIGGEDLYEALSRDTYINKYSSNENVQNV